MQIFRLLRKHEELIFYLADLILENETIEKVVCNEVILQLFENRKIVFKNGFPPSIIVAITTKMIALKLMNDSQAQIFHNKRWSYLYGYDMPKTPEDLDMLMFCLTGSELDILLLCGKGGLPISDAAILLNLSDEEAASRFLKAKRHLATLLVDDEIHIPISELMEEAQETVCALRNFLLERFPPLIYSFSIRFYTDLFFELSGKWIEKCKNHIQTFVLFIRIPKGMISRPSRQEIRMAVALSIILLSLLMIEKIPYAVDKLLDNMHKSKYEISQVINNAQFEPLSELDSETLDNLEYALTALPPSFRRTEHFRSRSASHTYYKNDSNQIILFSQEIAPSEVMGINTQGLEEISIAGRNAALESSDGLYKLYWFYNRYCYSLVTDLPRDTAIAIAKGALIKAQPYLTLQKLPIESIPNKYTPYLAHENLDVIFTNGEPSENLEALIHFVENCNLQIDGSVRVASFDSDGVTIHDLQMWDQHIYYTLDTHRNTQDNLDVRESGEEFTRISIIENNGENTITLYSDGKPHYEVLSYH